MFANPTKVGISQRVVATLVACAVVLFSIGAYTTAQAANLTNVSNTLTDSDPSATSAHSIAFTIPTGSALTDGDTVTITFPAGFGSVNTLVTGNITVTVNGSGDAHANFAAGASDISFDSVSASAGQEVIVAIAGGIVTNPATPGSYEFIVDTGTGGDQGKTRVAIVDNVVVSAIVDTVFDFTITGLATSTSVNGTSTTGSSSDTVLHFGTLTAGSPASLAQRLNVQTNARNGFVVTVETDGDLQSSNGAIIDVFDEGSDVDDADTVWNSPVPDVNDETTWGHWGVTTNDADLFSNYVGTPYTSEFTANEFIAASTTPRAIYHHDGPADNTTANIGQVDVLYQVEITALQEAADDYTTTLTYIATPTF